MIFISPQVPGVTGELTGSGAARSLEATVSAKIESDFYNARLMAWEPLMEPWGARLELYVEPSGLLRGGRSFPEDSSRRDTGSRQRPLGRRWRRQLPPRTAAPRSRQRGSVVAPGVGGATTAMGGGGTGTVIGVRFVSEEVLNVNLTESLVENLAAVAHAQQRQEESQKLARGWTGGGGGGGGDNDSFSLHWLHNETGLPVVCSAHCRRESRGSGSGSGVRGTAVDGNDDAEAAVPVRVPAGEEAPVGGSLGLPLRAVVLEFEEQERPRERGSGDTAAVATAVTKSWRSLRPIDLDVVAGQRLTTMVVAASASSSLSNGGPTAAEAERSQSSTSALGASSWRSGSWTWAARAASAAAESTAAPGLETVRVVTEVESHHGVKVR